ncbi:hypothetical protein LCGC14_0486350 [marine sediment metagenome]|uniref:50S ribosomal protein L17 n=1 Tax=marine sediment metagenome TaxID=412755 RepID=A0A0F9VGL6_9ZZZZ|nr:50S ribosomal protein L17 [Phycisphaerae bacterium]HDZ42507.1 50S ribosomal protein L17 [Phycisphaerae bacterium]
MRHRVDGKKLNRTTSHRKALWRNMAAALLQHGAIRTTEPKAKQLRRFVEKLITTAKRGTLHARRQVIATLVDRDIFDDEGQKLDQTIVQKLFNEIAPRYADRPGGYTRIIHLAERRIGDASKQVLLQLVEEEGVGPAAKPSGTSRRKKQAEKRRQAASAVAVAEPQAPDQPPADDAVEADEASEATDAPDQQKED